LVTAAESAAPVAAVVGEAGGAGDGAAKRGWFGGVLRHVHYRNMLAAQFVSNIGGWMELFGMQWLVAKKTGSLAMLGYLGAAHLLPILVFGTFGGLLADRVNRRTLLIVTQTLLMVVAALVAVLCALDFPSPAWLMGVYRPVVWAFGIEASPEVVAPLMVLCAANGVIAAFNMPAWQVLTPRLVPREELTRAITLNGVQFNLSRVVGPSLAGLVMGLAGATPLFVVNAVSFLVVVLTALTTPDAPALVQAGGGKPARAWSQVKAAMDFIFFERGPRAVFIAMTLMSLLAAPLVRVLPLFVIDVYGPSAAVAEKLGGLLLAVQGIGAVAGGLALRWVPAWYPKHHFIPLAVAAAGMSIVCFGASVTPAQGLVAMLVCGFFWIWAFNQSWAAMQTLVPDAMRGRVLALANVFSFGATALGTVGAGLIGERLKQSVGGGAATQASVVLLALPLMVAGIVMLLWRTPEVDGMARPSGGGRPSRSLVNAITAREHRPRG
jgi:MFS family permease